MEFLNDCTKVLTKGVVREINPIIGQTRVIEEVEVWDRLFFRVVDIGLVREVSYRRLGPRIETSII